MVKLHNDIFLGIDIFHINGLAFFVMASSKTKLVTTEEICSENMKMTLACLKSVVRLHNKRNPHVATIAGDDKFDPLKNILKEKCNMECNPTAADEHVAEVERMIRVVKERIQALCSRMPWNEAIPKLMMRETVKNSVMMINAFPLKSGINNYLSPCNIVTGKTLDYKTHFHLPFGDYAQVHQNEEPRNSTRHHECQCKQ